MAQEISMDSEGAVFSEDGKTLVGYSDGKAQGTYRIPGGVRTIGENAFSHYESIITRLAGVEKDCVGTLTVCVPESVGSIEKYAFDSCNRNLGAIIVDENNPYYSSDDGVLFHKHGQYLYRYPPGKKGDSYIIPKGVAIVAEGAFSHCNDLKSIEFPNTLIDIEPFAFEECIRLINIEIPGTVTSIGNHAFSLCSRLTNVILSDGVRCIEDCAFACCPFLKNITIPDSVEHIREAAFMGCSVLTIHCRENSTAHKYAHENKIKFKLT